MLGVAGILRQRLTGKVGAFAAMSIALVLRAHRNRALAVEGMPAGLDAAAAAAFLLVSAIRAMQTASGIDHL